MEIAEESITGRLHQQTVEELWPGNMVHTAFVDCNHNQHEIQEKGFRCRCPKQDQILKKNTISYIWGINA